MTNTNLPQLFNLLDTLPNPVTLNELAYDEQGRPYDKIIYVNKNFIKTIGYTTEDIPDDRAWFVKAYPDKEYQNYVTGEWFKAVEKAKEEENDLVGFPAKVHCKDGEDRWFSVTTQLTHSISDKYRTIIFVQTESPSETKLKLDERSLDLLHEKRLLKTIIDTAPVRIFWKDCGGVYLGCNKAFLEDAHLEDESEIIGKTDHDMVWKEDAERFREDDRRVRQSGVPELNFIERQPQKDGNYLVLSTSKVPLKNRTGNTIGVLGLYKDITKEIENEAKLKENDKLILVQSRQAAMGEMISMIAHQWKQPLSAIAAVVNTFHVQQALGQSSQENLDEQAKTIMDQVSYLSRTVSDFMNFFKQDKVKKEVHVCDAIDDALLIIGKLLENSGIELRVTCPFNRAICTFPSELQHVFIILLKNAADILVEKNKADKWISIITTEEDDCICFEVGDNGGGIDEHLMDRIFEPYFSTKDEKNGTGLGLYMSKTIVEKHLKGTMSCKNSDEGALFTVRLPLVF